MENSVMMVGMCLFIEPNYLEQRFFAFKTSKSLYKTIVKNQN